MVKSHRFSNGKAVHFGKRQEFPEVDRGGWCDLPAADVKLQVGQRDFLEQLHALLKEEGDSPA